jgi:hypothetical protein
METMHRVKTPPPRLLLPQHKSALDYAVAVQRSCVVLLQ